MPNDKLANFNWGQKCQVLSFPDNGYAPDKGERLRLTPVLRCAFLRKHKLDITGAERIKDSELLQLELKHKKPDYTKVRNALLARAKTPADNVYVLSPKK